MIEHIRETYRYRALLVSMVQRDLSARYRGSLFGFLWTFLNPLLLTATYSLVFSVYMRSNVEHYTFFLMIGLLPWSWFSTSLLTGTSSITDRRDLISKVRVAPQVLPLIVVGAALCNYVFSLPIALGLGLIERVEFGWPVVAWPLLVVLQLMFTIGIVYVTASINVVFRDLQHLLGNFVQFWFFLTPVLYPVEQIPERYRRYIKIVSPMSVIMDAYHDIFVHHAWPDWLSLAKFAILAGGVLYVGVHYLEGRRESFAEAA